MIKKGKVQQIKQIDEGVVETTIASVVEKTQGNYVEVLFRLDQFYLDLNGEIMNEVTNTKFDVYCDKTVAEVLTSEGITDYTWIQPLAEV